MVVSPYPESKSGQHKLQRENVSCMLAVVEHEAGRGVDGNRSSIGCRVWDLAAVHLDRVEFGLPYLYQ